MIPRPDESAGDGAPQPGVALAPGVSVEASKLVFAASRSSGPGGQNVNKVSTKMELRVALSDLGLAPGPLHRLTRLAGRRVTADGVLIIVSDEHRSQARNREGCLERLRELVLRALVPPKPRVATKPTKASRARRLEGKKQRGEVKKRRRPPRPESE